MEHKIVPVIYESQSCGKTYSICKQFVIYEKASFLGFKYW